MALQGNELKLRMNDLKKAGQIILGDGFNWRCSEQEEALEALLGSQSDDKEPTNVLAILGCGKGKSLLYLLPTIVLPFTDDGSVGSLSPLWELL